MRRLGICAAASGGAKKGVTSNANLKQYAPNAIVDAGADRPRRAHCKVETEQASSKS
jgi:hypothetical protein